MLSKDRGASRLYELLVISGSLLVLSVLVYTLQVAIFRKPQDTWFYLLQDVAFVPIQVLLVTVVLSELLERRQRRERLRHLNVLTGVFFNEIGVALLRTLVNGDTERKSLCRMLGIQGNWSTRQFLQAGQEISTYHPHIVPEPALLDRVKKQLAENRQALLGLLGNPNLLEHESFTDLLWAIAHLDDELEYRSDLSALPAPDLAHIAGDMQRAYRLLLREWLAYLQHLCVEYPFIFSFLVRVNPLNPDARPEVTA